MEEKHNNSNSSGFCDKIFNAIGECLCCQMPKPNRPTNISSAPTPPIHEINSSDGIIPIIFDHSMPEYDHSMPEDDHEKKELAAGKRSSTRNHMGNDHHMVDDVAFSDYINRAKIKIRTLSHKVISGKISDQHAGGSSLKDNDSANTNDRAGSIREKDQFSDYINRAKFKLRTTSSHVSYHGFAKTISKRGTNYIKED